MTARVPNNSAAPLEDRRGVQWAVVDVAYVREHCKRMTAARIAEELGESVARVRGLIYRRGFLRKRDTSKVAAVVSTKMHALPVPVAHDHAKTAAGIATAPEKRATARKSPPADLLAFLQAQRVADAARALGLSRRTALRIRGGYWPTNDAHLLRTWHACQGALAQRAGGWFLRRVYAGGAVRHAGAHWTAPALAPRTGQLVACARTAAGGLLVQTLELPAARFELARA